MGLLDGRQLKYLRVSCSACFSSISLQFISGTWQGSKTMVATEHGICILHLASITMLFGVESGR